MNHKIESTYALLVRSRSEEKGRGALEIVVFAVSILGVILTIGQFVQTPVEISLPGREPCVACQMTTTPPPHLGS
jgi:hypothetical protein